MGLIHFLSASPLQMAGFHNGRFGFFFSAKPAKCRAFRKFFQRCQQNINPSDFIFPRALTKNWGYGFLPSLVGVQIKNGTTLGESKELLNCALLHNCHGNGKLKPNYYSIPTNPNNQRLTVKTNLSTSSHKKSFCHKCTHGLIHRILFIKLSCKQMYCLHLIKILTCTTRVLSTKPIWPAQFQPNINKDVRLMLFICSDTPTMWWELVAEIRSEQMNHSHKYLIAVSLKMLSFLKT